MKQFNGCKNYTLIFKEELADIASTAYVLKHDKTGARIALIQNSDENKSFMIGFKTPQDNSTGVPHILEHSVLCGSEKYPVKDAMTEVSKGSLNTFLNAFTYPDRTVYPVASCNDKDFQNLMNVYLDAVFFPRVYKEDKIFKQEGWHYELDSVKSELKYNGVVYNEMKGVYSSPLSALSSYILFSLFPDTQYGVESGGDPDVIPDLSYEDFVNFHKKLYSPSNSRIFLYGDMDFEEKLEFIDREYLSKFEAVNPDSEIKLQKAFDAPLRIEKEYPISDSEDEKEASYLSYNVVCSDYTDEKTTAIMSVINYALVSVPGAKLKQRLIDAGIGKDVDSEFTTDTCQKVFSIIASNAKKEDEEKFVSIIEETIKEIISEGFDKKTLEAAITSSEFSYREADFGYYPKGIVYGMMAFDNWTYSDDLIFSEFKKSAIFNEMREGIENGLFEKVLKERILDNTHKTILIMNPKKGLAKEKEDELKAKLAKIKASFTKDELKKLVADTKALKKYQEEPDTKEALATIPTLSIDDIEKKVKKLPYEVTNIKGIPYVFCEQPTNGIAYFSFVFAADRLPVELLPAFSILKILLGFTNTENYSYGNLINEVNIQTGSLNFDYALNRDLDDTDKSALAFEIRGKALTGNLDAAFALVKEILFTSDLSDKKRVREILEQSKVRLQSYMISSGHAVAINRGLSYFSDSAKVRDVVAGLEQYRFIEKLCADFDNEFDGLVSDMKKVLSILLNRNLMEIYAGCEAKDSRTLEEAFAKFIDSIPVCEVTKVSKSCEKEDLEEGFSCSSQVQYVALLGNFKKAGLEYTGSLNVLSDVLSNDYLWTGVRLQGGAYGCMCGFSRTGDTYFVSYRDPNLKKTIEVYKKAADYIRKFPKDEELAARFVIMAIGEMDTPLNPSANVLKAYGMYKLGITDEIRQKERDEVLATDSKTIRKLAAYIDAVCEKPYFCTVGGEEMLSKEGDIFKTIVPLYKA